MNYAIQFSVVKHVFWCGYSMESKEKNPVVSRKKVAQERREAEKRERNRLHYQKNKAKIIKRVKESRQEKCESNANQRNVQDEPSKRSLERNMQNKSEMRHVLKSKRGKKI